jgi:hypothetical protein
MITLKEFVTSHPEWLDLPMAVYDGYEYNYIGCSGTAYEGEDDGVEILIFAGN